jgi:transcriptional regulator with XRE-family HTH domain
MSLPTIIPGFGLRLRQERQRLGLTQAEFAAKVNVNRVSQVFYEKGKNWPPKDYIESISALGVDLIFLLHGQRLGTIIEAALDLTLLTDIFQTIDDMEIECGTRLPPQVRAKIFAAIYGASFGEIGSRTMNDAGVKAS